jgi:hypothetical protein
VRLCRLEVLSVFRKTTWELNDYPVGLPEQEFNPDFAAPRFEQYRYRAYIENGTSIGDGETPQAAMSDLAVRFEETKAERNRKGQPMPRPGLREPIEFACQDRVNQHRELAEDFFRRALNLERAWISDDSSLWDFHTNQTNELLIARITEMFGVDVSDIESAKLCEIFDRIKGARSGATGQIDSSLAPH